VACIAVSPKPTSTRLIASNLQIFKGVIVFAMCPLMATWGPKSPTYFLRRKSLTNHVLLARRPFVALLRSDENLTSAQDFDTKESNAESIQ
jgi:hypothetical protein